MCLAIWKSLQSVSIHLHLSQQIWQIKRQQTCITYRCGSVSNSNSSSKDWDQVLQKHSSLGNSDHGTSCSSSWPQQRQGPRHLWHQTLSAPAAGVQHQDPTRHIPTPTTTADPQSCLSYSGTIKLCHHDLKNHPHFPWRGTWMKWPQPQGQMSPGSFGPCICWKAILKWVLQAVHMHRTKK